MELTGNSDNAAEEGQVIAIVNDTETWTGLLGLGVQGATFVQGDDKSLLDSLSSGNDTLIPSLSYGFTAGASYRLKQVPGSLTLGGYDAARIQPNDNTFALDSNQQPTVTLSSIEASGWNNSNVTLFGSTDQGLFTIDSSTPFLWLPEAAALRFEQTFGLEYNDTLQLYFYPNHSAPNSSLLSALSDCTFTFTLSDLSDSKQTLVLPLPGQAFTSLSLSYGYPGLSLAATTDSIPYWPIRKAANSTQYTLGRMFLQETYLTVDYERNNFSLSQAVFSEYALTNRQVIDIPSINGTSQSPSSSPHPSQGLNTGGVIGLVVGCICILFIVLGTLAILCVRKHRYTSYRNKNRKDATTLAELSSAVEITELHGTPSLTAVDNEPVEFPTPMAKSVVLGVDHDPFMPVELPLRTSVDCGRGVDFLPPTYAASTVSHSGSSFHRQEYTRAPSPGGVSPLLPPTRGAESCSGSEKDRGTWYVSSESEKGTNESRWHALDPVSRASQSTARELAIHVVEGSERARVDLERSTFANEDGREDRGERARERGSGAEVYGAMPDTLRAMGDAQRFSWESLG